MAWGFILTHKITPTATETGSVQWLGGEAYLELVNFFKLFQIRDQSYSIFQSFKEFDLKLYHFR